MKRIALVSIMLNEIDYVDRWVAAVLRSRNVFDEVVVVDGGSTDGTVQRLRAVSGLSFLEHAFPGRFDEQRNFAVDATTSDWVFELDADELLSAPFHSGIRNICKDADRDGVDCLGVARLNFIDGTLVAGPGHKGLDYQYRLHRRSCRWRGAVHEEIEGYRARCELAITDGHFLIHDKTRSRHEARNNYYGTITP